VGHRRLKHIVIPIKRHLISQSYNKKLKLTYEQGELSLPLQVAFLKGEGVLRKQFFTLMEQLHFVDPARQLELWRLLVIKPGYIVDFLQRIGLYHLTENNTSINSETQCFHLYCILLDSLAVKKEEKMLCIASSDLFRFYIYGLYPKTNTNTSTKNKADLLHHQALLKLRKLWGGSVVLKESFSTTKEAVEFSLQLKIKGHNWQTLTKINGERLKTTRINAYNLLLKELKQEQYQPENSIELTQITSDKK